MSVKTKDTFNFIYLWIRLHIHKIWHRIKFIDPASLGSPLVKVRSEVELSIGTFPDDFTSLSRSGKGAKQAPFPREISYVYSPCTEGQILRGSFIRLGVKSFLDAGKQAKFRHKQLEKRIAFAKFREEKLVVLPWGLGQASYGDFLIQVLPKLSRLLHSLTPEERQGVKLCLPEFSSFPWAITYLEMVGLGSGHILDGQETLAVPPGGKIIVGTGPSSLYAIAHPEDFQAMLALIARHRPAPEAEPFRKIYISRKMGRTMSNEAELLPGLAERDFEVISLENIPVIDQMRLFQEAMIVVGPHGAGHANILWANPGAHLLEVFAPTWMHPCYALLSEMLGIHYHCLVGYGGDTPGEWSLRSRYGIFDHPSIDPDVFFEKIDSIHFP